MRGDRHLIYVHGVKKSVCEWADQIRRDLRDTQVAGGLKVRLPNDKRWLTLVTSRWRAEDGIRFLKQRLGWDTFMVRYFRALQRLLLMGQLSFAFLAELVAEDSTMVGRIEEAALHFDEPIHIRAY